MIKISFPQMKTWRLGKSWSIVPRPKASEASQPGSCILQDIPHVKNQVYTKHSINASLHEHTHITKVSIQHFIKTFRKIVCPFWTDAILDADAPALGVDGGGKECCDDSLPKASAWHSLKKRMRRVRGRSRSHCLKESSTKQFGESLNLYGHMKVSLVCAQKNKHT